jgi:hypothetical protein
VWIYGANRQQVQIVGNDGEVVVKNLPDLTSKSKDNAPPAPPSRGRLKHVTMRMFSATSPAGQPDEVLVTDNIQFDNDTLLITTESFTDASGNLVAPDQVPVKVRGKYDLDGRGLKMRWNEKDGRLEMLRIENGEQLVINDPSSISSFSGPGARDSRRAEAPVPAPFTAWGVDGPPIRQATSGDPTNPILVSYQQSKPTARAPRPPRQPKTQPTTSATPYLATFTQNVRITQGEDLLAIADRIDVDFLTKRESENASTQPTASPTQSTTAPSPSAMQPATIEVGTTQPTTKPAAPPIIVRWTGPLIIVPAPVNRRMPLVSGSAIISLLGEPVTIVRKIPDQKKREEIKAATAIYYTSDGSASLLSSDESPLVVIKEFMAGKAEPLSTIITKSIDYIASDHVANLGPQGHVIAPADDAAPEKGNLDARWKDGAKLYLASAGQKGGEMAIQRMDAWGNVDIEHPQLSLQSQKLSLFFDPTAHATTRPSRRERPAGDAAVQPDSSDIASTQPATQPSHETHQQLQLQRVLANVDVHCLLTDSQGKHQTIDGQQLELLTERNENGQVYPHQVNAERDVHAFDDEQDLHSQKLQIAMRPVIKPPQTQATATTEPSTRPARQHDSSDVELDWMRASGQVIASSKGSTASGDELEVHIVDGEPHARISSADGLAKVIDAKKNIITGPLITAQTKRQIAHIEGAGSVQTVTSDDNGSNPRPVSVGWQQRADLNGPANTVDAVGAIVFHSVEQDGSTVDSTGDRVHIDLVEKPPTTRPTTGPAADPKSDAPRASQASVASMPNTRPTTRRSRAGETVAGASVDPMGQKQVKTVTLDGNARAVETLTDAQGNLQLQRAIEGPKLIYRAGTPQPAPSTSSGQAALTGSSSRAGTSAGSGLGATFEFEVPAAGRMLMQDHRSPEKRGPNDSGSGIDSGRGDTAFKWDDRLLYSGADHRATMTGGVIIVYQGLDAAGQKAKEPPVQIHANRAVAEFDPAKSKPAARPAQAVDASQATAPASRASADQSSLQLRQVIADGTPAAPAWVMRSGSRLTALQIRFDPQTHWITASGTPERPAQFDPGDGSAHTTAATLRWNSVTWNISIVGANVMGK